ncbi:hydroquinone glucosyltransferase-like [Neltuma alba]|uniref:hydroquinone glucosyltransferase-like n=1 Tax=Neltuma alba TaxID=207710 RepID=UPI0010A53C3B|nr:hydroquinone glucosyltransferase-like [Prosopis alba]
MKPKAHIAVISIPAFSHQASTLALCKRLLQLNPHLHITFIVPILNSLSNASKSLIDSFSSFNIHTILLPPVTFPQGSNVHPALQVPLTMSQSIPSIRDALNSLNSTNKLVALIADYLAYETLELAKTFNILSYIYFPLSASVLSLCLHSSWLDQLVSCEFRELSEPIKIPGCIPIHGRDLPNSLQHRSSQDYSNFLHRSKALHLADGILVNSFEGLEGGAITALLQEQTNKYPCIYPVGPNVNQVGCWVSSNHVINHDDFEFLRWLNKQEPSSVLYVSFGSGGTLSQNQMNELALGLELSGQKFLWVVREPNDLASANYFAGSKVDPLQFLPNGFVERVVKAGGQGMLVSCWAPQVEILSHKAIGAFLTQCGWFSILESVLHGLPIIAWPLFAEQRMNAAILSDGLNVSVRLRVNENGIVGREEITKVIKRVMIGDEGMRIRAAMEVLQHDAVEELKQEGSSSMNLARLGMEWKNMRG